MRKTTHLSDEPEELLGVNEQTNGSIILTTNSGDIVYEKVHEDGIDFFVFSIEDMLWGTILCDINDQKTSEFFSQYGNALKPEEYNEYDYVVKDERNYTTENEDVFLRILQYDTLPSLFWASIMLFDKSSPKVCAISFSCINEEKNLEYIEEIIKSIRFNY